MNSIVRHFSAATITVEKVPTWLDLTSVLPLQVVPASLHVDSAEIHEFYEDLLSLQSKSLVVTDTVTLRKCQIADPDA